jgi:hypothetical protein
MRWIHGPVFVVVLAAFAGCGKDLAPTEPAGGFARFSEALEARDIEALWQSISPQSQQLFDAAYDELVIMRELVTHLQPAEQAEARRRAGLDETASVDSSETLFGWFVRAELIPVADSYLGGLDAETVSPENEGSYAVSTAAGQEFNLVRADDGTWRVHDPLYTLFQTRLAVIATNRENLGATVALFGVRRDQRDALRGFGVGDGSGAN